MTGLSPRPPHTISQKECGHIKGTQKWGISGSVKWCDKCKKFVQIQIDWDGHP